VTIFIKFELLSTTILASLLYLPLLTNINPQHKIIPKHSKDLHIINGEGGTLVSFPTSIEFRTLRLEFLTKANIDEEAYKKSKCDEFELLCS
jgi:hypothetical protein